MKALLGLGSNEGDRLAHLETAVNKIKKLCSSGSFRVSPIYETPAMLPECAPTRWNRPFLNIVVEGDLQCTPQEFLVKTQEIEKELGRAEHEFWAPRTIDIDLLFWGDERIQSFDLTLPHPRISERAFVLDPLKDLDGDFLAEAKRHPQHAPLWMGIVNVTPDSFSEAHQWIDPVSIETRLNEWDEHFVGIIDVGAESTRPGATPITPQEEWERLQPILRVLFERNKNRILRPLISIDTRHYLTAARALDLGADMINDVSGMADLNILELIRSYKAQYILMHSLSIPSDQSRTLPEDSDPVSVLLDWFKQKTALIEASGISPEKIWIDPGIGFGKTPLQSIEILRNIDQFNDLPYRILVGHSRKSFLNPMANHLSGERDLETIGVSLNLASKGVDALRVHDPISHVRAFRAWNHINRSVP